MRLLLFFLLVTGNFCAFAQDSTLTFNIQTTFSGSTSSTPFWMHSNMHGVVPLQKTYASGHFGVYKIYNVNNPRLLQFSGGAEIITNYSIKSEVFFTDIYGAVRFGKIEFLVGQKRNQTGIMDSTLSSGSLSISGNSRPMPRFQISTPDFVPFNFTNGLVSFKASYSDGFLGSSKILLGSTNQIPSTYLHQKQIYFRIGNRESRLKIYAGVNHQAIWGSENKITPAYDRTFLNTYWHVITGKSIDYRKVGFHFGTYDIAGEWQGKEWMFMFYRQNIYENGSLFKVINFVDGLNGIKIRRRKSANTSLFTINSAVFEVIGTKDQRNRYSNPTLEIYKTGNYYNDFIYARGWSYYDRSMGTPLISSKDRTLQEPASSGMQFSNNNRIWAFHGGLTASWKQISFMFKGTFSKNFGTYIDPFLSGRNQLSMIIMAEKKVPFLNGLTLNAGLASDVGDLYPNSNGVVLGLKKAGFLN